MRKKRSKKFKERRKFIPLSNIVKIFLIFVTLGGIFFLSFQIASLPTFNINTITSNIEIGKNIEDQIKGKLIFSIKVEALRSKIIKKYPNIKDVSIVKVFPSTLRIKAEKREPFVQLKKDGFYILDEERVLLKKRCPTPYPNIFIIELGDYNFPLEIGKAINDRRLVSVYQLIKELKKSSLIHRFNINTISATSLYTISFFIKDVNIIVGEGNFSKKLFLLERLLEKKFSNKIDSLRYIDLRHASTDGDIYVGNKW